MVRLPPPASTQREDRLRCLGDWSEDRVANKRFHEGLRALIAEGIDDYVHASALLTLSGFYYESPPGAPWLSFLKSWKALRESAECGLHAAWVVMAEAHVKGDARFGVRRDLGAAAKELHKAIDLVDERIKTLKDGTELSRATALRAQYEDHLQGVKVGQWRRAVVTVGIQLGKFWLLK